jgi:DNA polymerase-3 subunit epsilon
VNPEETIFLVFDTETTGLDTATDRVVEVGACYFRGSERVGPGRAIRVNPEVEIPEGASAVHGIYGSDVADCPTFKDIAPRLISHFSGKESPAGPPVLAGYNAVRYDTPLLNAEFERHGFDFRIDPERVLDPLVFLRWHHRAWGRHKLELMAERFGVPLHNAHSASADAKATGGLLHALIVAGTIPNEPERALEAQATYSAKLEAEFDEFGHMIYRDRESGALHLGFGKHAGTPLEQAEPGYLRWCLDNMKDIPAETRQAFTERLQP